MSRIHTFLIPLSLNHFAVIAALFKKQYPPNISIAAWCPGGRQSEKTPFWSLFNNSSAPVNATSLLTSAASHVPLLIEVSEDIE